MYLFGTYTDMDKRRRHLALFTLCIFFGSGLGVIQLASAGGEWCVAKQGASEVDLQWGVHYACGVIDCSSIPYGEICPGPHDYASYVFNEYYQNNPQPASCVFGGAATLTSNDPSYGNCHYSSGGTSISPPTPRSPLSKPNPPPSSPNQPTPTQPALTPPSPRQAASPSGATSTSYSSLVFLACGLLVKIAISI